MGRDEFSQPQNDLSLPAARRAFDVVSSYWPLFSVAECSAIRHWLASLEHVQHLAAAGQVADDRLACSRGRLLCHLDAELTDLLPNRILRSDSHPFLRLLRHSGTQGREAPAMRQQFAADLRRWQMVNAYLPTGDTAALSLQEPPAPLDPFSVGPPLWSVHGPREQLLSVFLASDDWGGLVDQLAAFLQHHGIGQDQGCVAFRFAGDGSQAHLQPIQDFAAFDLSWLEGNEQRLAVLEQNTRHLLDGYRAHNTLIWGPRGCGKSSVIRGLITRYWDEGLRGIEVPYRSFAYLPQLFDLVRHRRQRFIAVLDNIGLARTDPATRMLSSALEGGLESLPQNLVFYATSNFKDLVDRGGHRPQGPPAMQADAAPDELRHTDSQSSVRHGFDSQGFQRLDEQRALDDRFALKVFIDLPTKTQYDHLVVSYARRAGIDEPEVDLLARFQMWRMRNNHDLVGGRTARDFIIACYPDRNRRDGSDAG